MCVFFGRGCPILPVGDVQRVLCVAARSRDPDDVSALRPDAVRPVHARGPRQRRVLGRRAAASRPALLRTPYVPALHPRRHPARQSPVPQGAHAVPRSFVLLHQT